MPLFYAMLDSAETLDTVLHAGANPNVQPTILPWAARAGADTTISLLVRAGACINGKDELKRTALYVAAFPDINWFPNGLAVALALVQHAGHLLDWDAKDEQGRTPLDFAQARADRFPEDVDSKRLLELYRTRRLPDGAQYIQVPQIIDAEDVRPGEDDAGLPPHFPHLCRSLW